MPAYFEDKLFTPADIANNPIQRGDYENCRFIHCDLSSAELYGTGFIDCEFSHCNLSMIKADKKTSFRDVRFTDCKLQGIHFNDCNELLFAARFENCLLQYASFYKMKMKNTLFRNCSFGEADLSEADFTNAVFDHCDFKGARFDHTILEKSDLSSSFNYSINPEKNKIRKAVFSIPEVTGLLHSYDILIR